MTTPEAGEETSLNAITIRANSRKGGGGGCLYGGPTTGEEKGDGEMWYFASEMVRDHGAPWWMREGHGNGSDSENVRWTHVKHK